jgi:hypothetical protein
MNCSHWPTKMISPKWWKLNNLSLYMQYILLGSWVGMRRSVTEHLVSRRSANFWRVLLWISCPKRNCSPTVCAPTESWIVEKDGEMSQMWPSKVEGIKWWKRKTTEHLEDYNRTPKKKSLKVALLPLWFKDYL